MRRWFFLLALLLIQIIVLGLGGPISVPPIDTVGCYDGLSTFYCESDRNDITLIQWIIDGKSLTDETAQLRGISVNTNGGNSSLSIIGSEANNDITIGCTVVTSGPPYLSSLGALFTVTDIPPVMNLTINFTSNGVMMCTWSQPSCLPINYSYSISVNNVSMINTTSTVYSMSNISSCTDYTVSVTVIDNSTQYQSLPVIETAKSGFYKDLEADLESTDVSFSDSINRFINITFKYRKPSKLIHCEQKLDFSGKIVPPEYSLNGKGNIITVNDLLQSYDESTGIGNYTIGPFNESFIGNYSLETAQDEEIATTKISTFNVQSASIIQLPNGSTIMECFFAYNSSADGCRFDLISQTKGNITSLSIPKDEYEDTSTLYTDINIPVGYYDVHVYDIVNGEIPTISAVNTSYHHIHVPTIGISPTTYSSSSITIDIATSSLSYTTYLPIKSTITISLPTISQEMSNDDLPTSKIINDSIAGIIAVILFVISFGFSVVCHQRRKLKCRVNIPSKSVLLQKNTATPHVYLPTLVAMPTQLVVQEINDNHDDDYMKDAVKNFHCSSRDTTYAESTLLSSLTTPESTSSQKTCAETKLDTECEQEEDNILFQLY